MNNFLENIAAAKLAENARLFSAGQIDDFNLIIENQTTARQSLKKALDQAPVPAIIAEIKKASPSKGVLAPDLDPPTLAQTYQENGAAALSVLTERNFFQGSPELISQLRSRIHLPILRKDFILEPVQVYESAAIGADALLLIVSLLPPATLRGLMGLTRQMGLEALVEVYTEEEMHQALKAGADLIGINHRNLKTFEMDLDRALNLAKLAPPDVTLVAASGLNSRADLQRLEDHGIHAFLIGESLVKAPDAGQKLRELRGK
jgi:indole-3-glycerol phosphate synthase